MNRLFIVLAVLLGGCALSSCRLPRHHAEVMHGSVLGGKVPLFKTGTISEFFRAGLILPDVGGYVRAEFDVLDVGGDGRVSSSKESGGSPKKGTVAQVAIPRLVSSFDLSRSDLQMRAALPAEKKPTIPLRDPEEARAALLIASAPVAPASPKPVSLPVAAPGNPAPVRSPTPVIVAAAAAPSAPVIPPLDVKDLWASTPHFTSISKTGVTISIPVPGITSATSGGTDVPWAVSSGFLVASRP